MSGNRRVTVVDYGVGNLFSVMRALEQSGAEAVLTTDPAAIVAADRLVLPGVGAFADGMSGLAKRGLIEAIRDFAARERPFLGICLGMQMMLDESAEFGQHHGLGIVPGRVDAVPPTGTDGRPHKIPHIGWNGIVPPDGVSWDGTPLKGIESGTPFYFVHSYAAVPADPSHCLAVCDYSGRPITSVIRSGSLYGCQFHPERSGRDGLTLLTNFCEL